MFCASFPGLRPNAEAERQAEAANARAHRSLRSASLCNLGCESKPRVVSSRESADLIAAQLDCNPQVTVIGVDAEWTQGAHSRVDVLSLCVPNFGVDGKARVFLFRLCKICQHEKQLPPNLLKLLQNDSKTFTGNRVQGCVTMTRLVGWFSCLDTTNNIIADMHNILNNKHNISHSLCLFR